jgi:hypothetical protein
MRIGARTEARERRSAYALLISIFAVAVSGCVALSHAVSGWCGDGAIEGLCPIVAGALATSSALALAAASLVASARCGKSAVLLRAARTLSAFPFARLATLVALATSALLAFVVVGDADLSTLGTLWSFALAVIASFGSCVLVVAFARAIARFAVRLIRAIERALQVRARAHAPMHVDRSARRVASSAVLARTRPTRAPPASAGTDSFRTAA